MKNKLLGFVLAFSLVFGITGQGTVYAEETDSQKETIAAEEKQFDTDYSITWGKDGAQCWSKITLDESGIIGIDFTKPESNTLGIIDIDVFVYDENENCISMIREEDDNKNGSVYIGLDQGTYYLMFTPKYSSFVNGQVSSYKFSFSRNENCEKELNNKKEDASPMKVDTAYTGYLGGGFSNTTRYNDEQDVYAIQLKKGQIYKFTYEKRQGNTIVKLLGKDTDFDSLWPSVEAKNFCVADGETFIAPYSGTYYVKIYNYGNAQYQYTVKISNMTPKATSLTLVKAGNDAFTAKWKKTDCSGYQIQYSTSKNFKNAVSVKVSGSKVSTTVKKLDSNKKYYVRIRTYKTVGNKVVYSSWSKAKTVTTT